MKTRASFSPRRAWHRARLPLLAAGLAMLVGPAHPAVIYSGLRDLVIPTGFTGIYLDLDAGTTSTSESVGWDINPFFGGVGVANNTVFQPARTSTANSAPILGLAVGATVDVTRFFFTGYGGSQTHLGTQFTAGQEGYLGFRFTTNAAAGPYYGWMRVVFTGNVAGALIKDWAYENGGGSIVTARVAQSAPVSSAQVVTLSPVSGEAFTFGSALTNTGGNTNSLVKTGAGTVTLAGATTYTGSTTVSGGTLNVNSVIGGGTSAVSVTNPGSKLKFGSVSQRLASLSIGAGATVVFTSGVAAGSFGGLGDGEKGQIYSAGDTNSATVPEPGTLGLLMAAALGAVGKRGRRAKSSPRSTAGEKTR